MLRCCTYYDTIIFIGNLNKEIKMSDELTLYIVKSINQKELGVVRQYKYNAFASLEDLGEWLQANDFSYHDIKSVHLNDFNFQLMFNEEYDEIESHNDNDVNLYIDELMEECGYNEKVAYDEYIDMQIRESREDM